MIRIAKRLKKEIKKRIEEANLSKTDSELEDTRNGDLIYNYITLSQFHEEENNKLVGPDENILYRKIDPKKVENLKGRNMVLNSNIEVINKNTQILNSLKKSKTRQSENEMFYDEIRKDRKNLSVVDVVPEKTLNKPQQSLTTLVGKRQKKQLEGSIRKNSDSTETMSKAKNVSFIIEDTTLANATESPESKKKNNIQKSRILLTKKPSDALVLDSINKEKNLRRNGIRRNTSNISNMLNISPIFASKQTGNTSFIRQPNHRLSYFDKGNAQSNNSILQKISSPNRNPRKSSYPIQEELSPIPTIQEITPTEIRYQEYIKKDFRRREMPTGYRKYILGIILSREIKNKSLLYSGFTDYLDSKSCQISKEKGFLEVIAGEISKHKKTDKDSKIYKCLSRNEKMTFGMVNTNDSDKGDEKNNIYKEKFYQDTLQDYKRILNQNENFKDRLSKAKIFKEKDVNQLTEARKTFQICKLKEKFHILRRLELVKIKAPQVSNSNK